MNAFSVVGCECDPATAEVGVVVEGRFFAVGAVVPQAGEDVVKAMAEGGKRARKRSNQAEARV